MGGPFEAFLDQGVGDDLIVSGTAAWGRISSFRGDGGKVCNRRVSPVAPRPGEGPLTEPTAGAQPWPRERVLMPLTGRST
jgi:hypothetical protein